MALDALPTELLWAIDGQLGDLYAARLALRLSCQSLHLNLLAQKLPPPNRSLCELLQLQSWFENDPDRRYCRLCKMWCPKDMFESAELATEAEAQEAGKILKDGFGQLGGPGMVDLPYACCIAHRGSLIQDVQGLIGEARWKRARAEICLHCGQLRDALHLVGFCDCDTACSICGEREVVVYLRMLDDDGSRDDSKGYVVYKKGGIPMVREWFSANLDQQPQFIRSLESERKTSVVRHGQEQIAVDFSVPG